MPKSRGFTRTRINFKEICGGRGFTLIELLVVISIISILSVVGFVSYQNVTLKAKDAKMKADIDAIKKAYETNYDPSANGGQGGYKELLDSNFASGKIPTPPGGGSYLAYLGPGPGGLPGQNQVTSLAYKVCAPNTSTCASSTQGDTSLVTQINSLSNPSCDPTGSLALGLVGYWKMDEESWNGTSGEVKDSSGNNSGRERYNATITADSKFGKAGNFIGTTDTNTPFVEVPYNPLLTPGNITISFWMKTPGVVPAASFAGIIQGAGGNGYSKGFRFYFLNNTVNWQMNFGGNGPQYIGMSNVDLNTWVYIAGTFDGKDMKLYRGTGENPLGVTTLSPAVTTPINWMGSGTLQIGFAQFGFNGQLDDVRIYNRALSPVEITTLYGPNGAGCVP